MSAQNINRTKMLPDYSEDDFLSAIETFINKAYYPKYNFEIARISNMAKHDIGEKGELASIVPFYFMYKPSIFIPDEQETQISLDRENIGFGKKSSYSFSLDIDLETSAFQKHNALYRLSQNVDAAYLVPFFYRKKRLSILKNNRVVQPWRYEEISVYDSYLAKGKTVLKKIPLLSQAAVLYPHKEIEKSSDLKYYSYNTKGDIGFHGEPEKVKQKKDFVLVDFLEEIIVNNSKGVDLAQFSEQMIELVPELFDQKWSSRKLKLIVENIVYDIVERQDFPANYTFTQILESLNVFQKLYLVEVLLRKHLGIVQYFKLEYKN